MATLQEIQEQIASLQKQAKDLVQAERQPVIDRIKGEIKSYGITAKELGLKGSKASSKPTDVEAKERVPVVPRFKLNDKTWSGRGRPPAWLVEFERNGGKRSALEINLSEKSD